VDDGGKHHVELVKAGSSHASPTSRSKAHCNRETKDGNSSRRISTDDGWAKITVTPTDGGSPSTSRDKTSYAPILGEIQYAVLPRSRVNPRLGLTAGKFFTRDVQLRTEPSAPLVDYEFENPIITLRS